MISNDPDRVRLPPAQEDDDEDFQLDSDIIEERPAVITAP